MKKTLLLIICGLLLGILLGFSCISLGRAYSRQTSNTLIHGFIPVGKQVIGFLPYWLLEKADKNYAPYITTLTYFGLTVETDGHIQKYTDEDQIEGEPGWVALQSGKITERLRAAKKQGKTLSLLIFRADNDAINTLISDPIPHAKILVTDVAPIMKTHGFSDLNIDIESVESASDEARINFTKFLAQVKSEMDKKRLGTLTVEITGDDLIKKKLLDPKAVANIADYIVIMAYDYHYAGSFVTGPVAPLGGGGTEAEYDTEIALQKALAIMPAKKIILGIPLYGYQWETIGDTPRSAIIPGTGQTASNRRMETFLSECATCSAQTDSNGKEEYLIYKDEETGVYEQIFFPDQKATQAKVHLAEATEIGGIALWALGYEGNTVMEPLRKYIR